MLEDIELNFLPKVPRSLAWSQEGDLAVAAGEHVHLLIPNRRRQKSNGGAAVLPWIRLTIQVNQFNQVEWPIPDCPRPFSELSIGEEQAVVEVIALGWSNPGLSRFMRCALAVLTSNHLLSIWTSDSDMTRPSSWQRVAIINDAIERYLMMETVLEGARALPSAQRAIHHFTWAPTLPVSDNLDERQTLGKEEQLHFLASINEHFLVLVLLTRNDATAQDRHTGLEAKVIHLLRIRTPWSPEEREGANIRNSLQQMIYSKQLGFDVQWSTWTQDTACHVDSLVIYRKDSKLSLAKVQYRGMDKNAARLGVDSVACALSCQGPFLWQYIRDGIFTIIQSSSEICQLQQVRASGQPVRPDESSSLDLALGWNTPSDICRLDYSEPRRYRFCISSPATRPDIFEYCTSPQGDIVPNNLKQLSRELSALELRIQARRFDFAKTHGLDYDQIREAYFGTRSMGSFLVTCVSFHPKEHLEYIMSAAERSYLVFMQSDQGSNADATHRDETVDFPWEGSRTEIRGTDHYAALWRQLSSIEIEKTESNCQLIYAQYCANLIVGFDRHKGTLATDILCRLGSAEPITPAGFAYETAMPYSSSLKKVKHTVEEVNEMIRLRALQEASYPNSPRFLEYCQIIGCGQYLIAKTRYTGTCAIGTHPYSRCTLTFKAIQAPGISKQCEICQREYLNEYKMLQPEELESPSSILASLLTAYKTCILCNGKFIVCD